MELYIINGLVLGSIYALIALGLNLIWSITDIPDFSQGGIYVIAAYVVYFCITSLSIPWYIAMLVAALVGAIMAYSFEKLLYRRWRGRTDHIQLLCAIALFFLLANLAIYLWTAKSLNLEHYIKGVVNIFGVGVSYQRLMIIVVVIILFVVINLFLKKTKTGKAIRAATQDIEVAPWMGIDINKVFSIIFAMGGALSGIAATLIAPVFAVYPMMGELPLLKALVVVILGGKGSLGGTLIAGMGLGVLESLGAGYISTSYQHGYAFIILLIVLIFRPQGLFGSRKE
ncbi:MAG: branched-chain amino acid ABC transporter permease [Bacillota bacterium]|nr:branched-chain amino acid ABC transporter permease [Bacillota bacterium]